MRRAGRDAFGRRVVQHLAGRDRNLVHEVEHAPVRGVQRAQHVRDIGPAFVEQRSKARLEDGRCRVSIGEPRLELALQRGVVERRTAELFEPLLVAATRRDARSE